MKRKYGSVKDSKKGRPSQSRRHNIFKLSPSHGAKIKGDFMSIFRITGNFKMGSKRAKFSKEIIADTSERAKERAYSILGSKHGTKRDHITIEAVEEILPEDVTDPIVRVMVEAKQDGTE